MHNQVINEDIPVNVLDARMFHHDSFLNESKSAIGIETYTGPIYSPTHVDAAGILDGVIA